MWFRTRAVRSHWHLTFIGLDQHFRPRHSIADAIGTTAPQAQGVRVKNIIRENTPWLVPADSPGKRTLAPQLVEAAVLRLRWISLICAVLAALLAHLGDWLQPETGRFLKGP